MNEVNNKIKLKYLLLMVSKDYNSKEKVRQEIILTDGRARLLFKVTW